LKQCLAVLSAASFRAPKKSAESQGQKVFFAAYKAGTQWGFHRYVLCAKAQYFHATVTFPVK